LGDFLVERSRLLWAFWSGDASNVKPGGTTDVVLRKSRRLAGVGDPENAKNTENVEKTKNAESIQNVENTKNIENTKNAENAKNVENAGCAGGNGCTESAGKAEDDGNIDCAESVGSAEKAENTEGAGNNGRAENAADSEAEAICCVATPEVLRVKNPDGTKTRIPESTENAGKLAFWTSPLTDAPPKFESSETIVARLTRFIKKR